MNKLPVFFLFFILVFSSGCGNQHEENNKLKVVATTGLVEDILLNLAGDLMEVNALMGPGVDPHLYKATHGDLALLNEADAIFYNGLYLEGKMDEVLKKMEKNKFVKAVAATLNKNDLLASVRYQNAYDPHVWFDVSLWSQVVLNTGKLLAMLDTANHDTYMARAKAYASRLDSLHLATKEQVATIPENQRMLITSHDAFRYFGRAYNIEVRGLQGLSTVSGFGLKDVTDLVEIIIRRNIKAVFVESSVSEKAIKSVVEGCRERGHDVTIGGTLYSDAMGEKGTEEGTYIGMVNHNVRTIVESLK